MENIKCHQTQQRLQNDYRTRHRKQEHNRANYKLKDYKTRAQRTDRTLHGPQLRTTIKKFTRVEKQRWIRERIGNTGGAGRQGRSGRGGI